MVKLNKPIIRCSGLDRLLSCPGSRTLEAKLAALDSMVFDDEADGDNMTWRGNWIHWDSARRLVLDHGAIAHDGLEKPQIPKGWKPQPWDERTSTWYVDNVVALTPEDHALFVERRFTVEFERFILTGQVDCYSISPDGETFAINDDKTGLFEVDHAERNWQLAGYAAVLKRAVPTLKRGKLRILQKEAEEQVTEAEVDDLDTVVSYMEERINAALDAWLEIETGHKQCRLCPCIEFCPAIAAELEAMKIILTPEEVDALKVTPNLKQLAEVAARGRAIAGPIKKLLDRLKERIQVEGPVVLEDGTQVRVVEENGKRTITAPKVAFAFVARKANEIIKSGVEEDGDDIAWKAMDISVGAIEDELVELGMQRKSTVEGKETAQKWIKQSIGHLIVQAKHKELKFS